MGVAIAFALPFIIFPFFIGILIGLTEICRRKNKRMAALQLIAMTTVIAIPSFAFPFIAEPDDGMQRLMTQGYISAFLIAMGFFFCLVEKLSSDEPNYIFPSAMMIAAGLPAVLIGVVLAGPAHVVSDLRENVTISHVLLIAFILGCFSAYRFIDRHGNKREALSRLVATTVLIASVAHFLPVLLSVLESSSSAKSLHDQAASVLVAIGLASIMIGKIGSRHGVSLYGAAALLAIAVHPKVYAALWKALLSLGPVKAILI